MLGTIVRLNKDRGFGFIAPADHSDDVFFHFRDLVGLEFDDQLKERRVEFTATQGEKGPRARNIRPAN